MQLSDKPDNSFDHEHEVISRISILVERYRDFLYYDRDPTAACKLIWEVYLEDSTDQDRRVIEWAVVQASHPKYIEDIVRNLENRQHLWVNKQRTRKTIKTIVRAIILCHWQHSRRLYLPTDNCLIQEEGIHSHCDHLDVPVQA